tara:strand:+ start:235 stop:759 length:525 start_codon:yes stop_codon:yes gene_type:complete
MKTMKLILLTAGTMAFAACNNPQIDNNGHDHQHHEEMKVGENHDHSQIEDHQEGLVEEENAEHQKHKYKKTAKDENGNYGVGDQVPTKQVCMVNDAYMAKDQIPVPVNGKTYYGCCQMCVKTLNEQETARVATDPQTGEKVDKTEAYIVLLDKEGTVAYFESKTNAEAYAKKYN